MCVCAWLHMSVRVYMCVLVCEEVWVCVCTFACVGLGYSSMFTNINVGGINVIIAIFIRNREYNS